MTCYIANGISFGFEFVPYDRDTFYDNILWQQCNYGDQIIKEEFDVPSSYGVICRDRTLHYNNDYAAHFKYYTTHCIIYNYL